MWHIEVLAAVFWSFGAVEKSRRYRISAVSRTRTDTTMSRVRRCVLLAVVAVLLGVPDATAQRRFQAGGVTVMAGVPY
jgi:hypothetical protein